MPAFCRRTAIAVCIPLLLGACADHALEPLTDDRFTPQFSEISDDVTAPAFATGDVAAFLSSLNQQLAAQGANYTVLQADILLAEIDPQRQTTIFANDRTHELGYRFAAGDARRGSGPFLRQASFIPLIQAPTSATTRASGKPAIDASFATWNDVRCSSVEVLATTLPGNVNPSAILGIGGFINNPFLNDINTLGFLPGSIFNAVLGPGASTTVLGVTFPFTFIDAAGNPTDIDHDGRADLAFAEIWYNAAFRWTVTGTTPGVDVQSVALHENGHALGLGHFGKIFQTGNGKLHFAPRAVMNAAYSGIQREVRGTDNGSFCGLWASW
jgi:hypothetical protein